MAQKVQGYPKLSKLITEKNIEHEVSALIGVSVAKLHDILGGKNDEDFCHDEAIIMCRYLEVLPDDVFF